MCFFFSEEYLHILKTAGTVGTALFPSFTAGCPCAPVADTEGEAASCGPRVVSPPRWPRIEAVGMDFGPGAPGGRAWEDAEEGSQAAGPPGAAEPSSTRGTVFERSAFALESARRPSSRDSPVPISPQRPAGSGADDSLGGGVAGRRWSSPGLGAARLLRRPARGVPVSGRRGRQSGRRAPIGREGGGGRGSAAFPWAAPASPPRRP